MRKNYNFVILASFYLLLLSLVQGCNGVSNQPIEGRSTQIINPYLFTETNTRIPTFTSTPKKTQEPTLAKTELTFPTIAKECTRGDMERNKCIESLFFTNNTCSFPCWWGITPGSTTLESARAILNNLPFLYAGLGYRTYGKLHNYLISSNLYNISLGLYETNKIVVVEADIRVEEISQQYRQYNSGITPLLPINVLRNNGTPDKIGISIEPLFTNNYGSYMYNLIFEYQRSEFIIMYTGYSRKVELGFEICPDVYRKNTYLISVYFISGKRMIDVRNVDNNLEIRTNIRNNEYYQNMIANKDYCFIMPE